VINKTIERYLANAKNLAIGRKTTEENTQHLKDETAELRKKIELLEDSKRRLLGESLESCSVKELEQVEQLLERSLNNIRARKNTLFNEQIDQLKEQEKKLMKENTRLRKKFEMLPLQLSINLPTVRPPAQAMEGHNPNHDDERPYLDFRRN
ncbi:UNVERIFIED_CONTAM: MADS-box protein SOC1, partial [Sesamum calycinum]